MSGILTQYANQSLAYLAWASENVYAEATYSTSATIKGRKQTTNKLIRTPDGKEVVAGAFILTQTAVNVKDKIDGRMVISSEPVPGLDGNTLFYEVYTL